MFRKLFGVAGLVGASLLISGCASPYLNLPVREGTVVDARYSMRQEFRPSTGGALAGGALGGVAGRQIGKGSGRKVATALGILAGASLGATAGGSTQMVPISLLVVRDNFDGREFRISVDGQWRPGMVMRYSVAQDGQFIVR